MKQIRIKGIQNTHARRVL